MVGDALYVHTAGLLLIQHAAIRSPVPCAHTDVYLRYPPGFSISSAFSKYHFELEIANFIQVRIGHRPRLFLLAFMSMGFFLSMVRASTLD